MMSLRTTLAAAAVALSVSACSESCWAQYGRQYYSSWTYYPTQNYYVSTYYYKPVATVTTYSYHYCIHYASEPRYVYYYNPVRRYYWGRLDLEGKEGEQYSLLAEKDRKESKTDIPESAFPKPGAMPALPDAEDGTKIEPIKDKPVVGKEKELPKGK